MTAIVASLTGCGAYRSYSPPPLIGQSDVDPRAVRSIDRFQLAVSLRFVGANDGAPMLTLRLRNAGFEGVRLDVARLQVAGYAASGARRLYLVDPRGEIEPLTMEPGVTATERVRLADPHPTKGELSRVCVDPSPMLPTAVEPICFVPTDDASWAVAP